MINNRKIIIAMVILILIPTNHFIYIIFEKDLDWYLFGFRVGSFFIDVIFYILLILQFILTLLIIRDEINDQEKKE